MTGDLTPPAARTRLGLEMTAAIAPNSLQLQHCDQCATVQYPPREVCRACLSDKLTWRDTGPAGIVLASSTLHHCLDPWFNQRTPWLMGSVKLDCGAVVFAHLAANVAAAESPVWVFSVKDGSGQAVLVAISQSLDLAQAASRAQHMIMGDLQEMT
jgi:uncharacterized OB-fold protein